MHTKFWDQKGRGHVAYLWMGRWEDNVNIDLKNRL